MQWNDLNNRLLINEVHMSGQEFRDVINHPDILLGFELEFFIKSLPKQRFTFADFNKDAFLKKTDYMFLDLFRVNMRRVISFYKKDYIAPFLEKKLKTEKGRTEIAEKIADLYIFHNQEFKDLFNSKEEIIELVKRKILRNKQKVLKYYIMYLEKFSSFSLKNDSLNYAIKKIAEDKENWRDYFHQLEIKIKRNRLVEMLDNGDFLFNTSADYIAFDDIKTFLKDKFPEMKFGHSRDNWTLTSDGSLDIDGEKHGSGIELISPPMPLKESLTWIKRLFEMIDEYDMSTTDACGFHMGISFDKKTETKKVDPLKFVLFLGDKYVLKLFKRYLRNYMDDYSYPEDDWDGTVDEVYSNSIIYNLKKSLRRSNKDLEYYIGTRKLKSVINKVRKHLVYEKYMSVNLEKLHRGYIEVRSAGGENYHQNFDKVKNAALRYARALVIAHDPDMYKEEYIKKIVKILQEALEGWQPSLPSELENDFVYKLLKKEIGGKYVILLNPAIAEVIKKKDFESLKKLFNKLQNIFLDNSISVNDFQKADFEKIIKYMQKFWGYSKKEINRALRYSSILKVYIT